MSVCGGCPYPYEKTINLEEDEEIESRDDICGWGCSHEDAAYRAQWAYDKLMERYESLNKENEELKRKNKNLEIEVEDLLNKLKKLS